MSFITSAEAKSILQISVSTYDTLIATLLPIAQGKIVRFCRNTFPDLGIQMQGTGIAFVSGSPATITDTEAGFLDALFAAGHDVCIHGSSDNDGIYALASAVAGTLTLATGETLTDEDAGNEVTITRVRWPKDIKYPAAELIGFMVQKQGKFVKMEQSNRLLKFFASQGMDDYKAEYYLTGEPQVAHRSTGLMATNAVAALAADREIGEPFVQALWDQAIPTGQYRYYDGLLMMLGLLQVSGNFRIYEPGSAPEGQVFPTPMPEVAGKFAPPIGNTLLLVGQDKKNIDAYFDATVTAPGGLAIDTSLQLNRIKEIDYLAENYPNSVLSIGVDLKGVIAEVADGKADAKIDALLDALTVYNRPVYLRLGYGFNDPANKYAPDVYVSAWKKFHERIQVKGSANVALVWQSASCGESPIADWYPGDEFVDWVGGSYGECADDVVQFAREHYKPVMIKAASQSASWDEWFAPFFKFVTDNNDVIRAAIYINADESRIQLSDDIIKKWKAETKQSFWLRGGPDLFVDLGFTK